MIVYHLNGTQLYSDDASAVEKSVENAVMHGVDLSGADLTGLILDNLDLTGANLVGASLKRVSAKKTNFIDAKLMSADMRYGKFSNARFRGANLTDALLGGSYLRHAFVNGAILNDVEIEGVTTTMPIIEVVTGRYHVTIFDEHMTFSCQLVPIIEMFEKERRDIIKMDGKKAVRWWSHWREAIKQICIAGGRNVEHVHSV